MACKYEIKCDKDDIVTELLVLEPKSGYTLVIYEPQNNIHDHAKGILFRVPYPADVAVPNGACPNIAITTRDLSHYPAELMPLQAGIQYLEVGPGLGEFIPYAAKQQGIPKPIAIDPANYSLMGEMLEDALGFDVSPAIKDRIRIVLERCKIMLDTNKVALFNATMGKALEEHPELKGIADIVVENWGPSVYPVLEAPQHKACAEYMLEERVRELIRMLAKERGRIYRG